MKFARKPRRSRPATSATAPTASARPAVYATNSSEPTATNPPTTPADSAAVADIGPTTRCRELPNNGYSSKAGMAAYRPITGDTPAMDA